MSFFSNKPKSVDTILGGLTNTIGQLEVHAEEQLAKAALKAAEAEAAKLAHEAHKAEHELAQKVAGNIKGLLGL